MAVDHWMLRRTLQLGTNLSQSRLYARNVRIFRNEKCVVDFCDLTTEVWVPSTSPEANLEPFVSLHVASEDVACIESRTNNLNADRASFRIRNCRETVEISKRASWLQAEDQGLLAVQAPYNTLNF